MVPAGRLTGENGKPVRYRRCPCDCKRRAKLENRWGRTPQEDRAKLRPANQETCQDSRVETVRRARGAWSKAGPLIGQPCLHPVQQKKNGDIRHDIAVYAKSACMQCTDTTRALDTQDMETVTSLGYRQAPVVVASEAHWAACASRSHPQTRCRNPPRPMS